MEDFKDFVSCIYFVIKLNLNFSLDVEVDVEEEVEVEENVLLDFLEYDKVLFVESFI